MWPGVRSCPPAGSRSWPNPSASRRPWKSREPDEAKTQAELIETLLGISNNHAKDEHEALRAVHAKSHGLLKARFTVLDGLPPQYAQGLFAQAGRL